MRFLLILMSFLYIASATQNAFASQPTVHAEPPKLMQIDTGVFRGIQPETPADYAALKAVGIHTILNLRWDKSVAQSKADAEAAGFKFVNVPVNAVNGPTDRQMKAIFEAIEVNKAGGLLFHCTLGRDRTGLVAALYRVTIQHATPSAAYAEWTRFGFSNSFLKKLDAFFWKATKAHAGNVCQTLFAS